MRLVCRPFQESAYTLVRGYRLISVGTVFFGISSRFWMSAISRILQGFASSILYIVGLAALVDTVGRDEVGQWMGTAMSCNNVGIIYLTITWKYHLR